VKNTEDAEIKGIPKEWFLWFCIFVFIYFAENHKSVLQNWFVPQYGPSPVARAAKPTDFLIF